MTTETTTSVTSGVREDRVLVVDDEPIGRETLGQALTEEGYVVDLAVNGATALECVLTAGRTRSWSS